VNRRRINSIRHQFWKKRPIKIATQTILIIWIINQERNTAPRNNPLLLIQITWAFRTQESTMGLFLRISLIRACRKQNQNSLWLPLKKLKDHPKNYLMIIRRCSSKRPWLRCQNYPLLIQIGKSGVDLLRQPKAMIEKVWPLERNPNPKPPKVAPRAARLA